MQVTDLGGHSGCQIILCEEESNKVFVRKISSSKGYNERLVNQARKQQNFNLSSIKTPKIFQEGYTPEGMFFFDMEYIQGITLAEYMKTVRIGEIKGIVENIVLNIVGNDQGTNETKPEVFERKIDTLFQSIGGKDEVIDGALSRLRNHDWDKFTVSFCHGDLTLENIIVKDNQLYLIDFLDSFYDSWIMDISTLMQDVQTLWSYRFESEPNINTILRLIIFRDILMDTVKNIMGNTYIEVYYALLLKLIRIIPYTHDELTYKFLIDKIQSILEMIKKEEAL